MIFSSPIGRGRGPSHCEGKVRGYALSILTPHPPTGLRPSGPSFSPWEKKR